MNDIDSVCYSDFNKQAVHKVQFNKEEQSYTMKKHIIGLIVLLILLILPSFKLYEFYKKPFSREYLKILRNPFVVYSKCIGLLPRINISPNLTLNSSKVNVQLWSFDVEDNIKNIGKIQSTCDFIEMYLPYNIHDIYITYADKSAKKANSENIVRYSELEGNTTFALIDVDNNNPPVSLHFNWNDSVMHNGYEKYFMHLDVNTPFAFMNRHGNKIFDRIKKGYSTPDKNNLFKKENVYLVNLYLPSETILKDSYPNAIYNNKNEAYYRFTQWKMKVNSNERELGIYFEQIGREESKDFLFWIYSGILATLVSWILIELSIIGNFLYKNIVRYTIENKKKKKKKAHRARKQSYKKNKKKNKRKK